MPAPYTGGDLLGSDKSEYPLMPLALLKHGPRMESSLFCRSPRKKSGTTRQTELIRRFFETALPGSPGGA
jgi:hypothetical protein